LKVDKINGKDPDFIVYAEFTNQEALDAYKAHPLYKKSISIVRPLRDMRIAADFLG
jgi:ABC-type Fe3+-hydroxamate transport system substrate-binding protein